MFKIHIIFKNKIFFSSNYYSLLLCTTCVNIWIHSDELFSRNKIKLEGSYAYAISRASLRQSRAERALSLSETGARSRFSLSASASALNKKKRELELERRPTERFARTLTAYQSEIKTFGPNLVHHEKVRNCTDDFPNLYSRWCHFNTYSKFQ